MPEEKMSPYFASLSTLVSAWRRDYRRRDENVRSYAARAEGFALRWRARTLANAIANQDNQ